MLALWRGLRPESVPWPRPVCRDGSSALHWPTISRAWSVLNERERLALDLVTFCGLKDSEAYGLKNGDLFQPGAIRIERFWYSGEVNPTKTTEIREVGVDPEIFERRTAWIASLPERSNEGGSFPASGS